MLVPGFGDFNLPLEALGAQPGEDAYDDPAAMLASVSAERVTIGRILHGACIPLQEQLLDTIACVDERRELLSEAPQLHTRASAPQTPPSSPTCSPPNVIPKILSSCHQSVSRDAQSGHVDIMGSMAESKWALTAGGGAWIQSALRPSGAHQPVPISSCYFPRFDRATLISAPGPEPRDMDVEISCNSVPAALHMNRDSQLLPSERLRLGGAIAKDMSSMHGRRGAYVRSQGRIYLAGSALCDHPAIARGSVAWFQNMMARPDVRTRRRARAVLALRPGGYNAWRRLTPAQQGVLAALQ